MRTLRFILVPLLFLTVHLSRAEGKQEFPSRTVIGQTWFYPMTDRTDLPVLTYRCSRGHYAEYLSDSGEIDEIAIWKNGMIAWKVSPEIRRDNTRIYQTTIPVEKVEAAVQKIAESYAKYPMKNRPERAVMILRLGQHSSPSVQVHASQHYETASANYDLLHFYKRNRVIFLSDNNKAKIATFKKIGGNRGMFHYKDIVNTYRGRFPNEGLSKENNPLYLNKEILTCIEIYKADTEHLLLAVEIILALVPSTEGLTGERPTYGDSHDFTVEMAIKNGDGKDGKAEFFYIPIPAKPKPEPEPEPPATQTDIDFWFLKPDEGATPSNRRAALWRVSTTLYDFGIYLPSDIAIPDDFRNIWRTLSGAGYKQHTDVCEERLAQATHESGSNHRMEDRYEGNVYYRRFSVLVIHQDISLPVKDIERLPHLRYMFLGEAPKMPEGVAFVDKVGNNLIESIASLRGPKLLPESILLALPNLWLTKSEINIRQGTDENWDAYADDILYFLSNDATHTSIIIPAKPIDGWFSLQELKSGRDGFKDDRAFFMDSETGKIGEAAVRKNPATGKLEVRIQMKPEESLIVRIVRERVRYGEGLPTGIGFMEFESLPDWEYEKK